jgi:hypothetical protein
MKIMKIEVIKKYGFAISIIAFPVMLLTGFLMHHDLLKLEALQTVEQLVGRFHNQPKYHIGHLIVMFDVPVIMIALISFMNVLQDKGRQLGFWGGIISLFGAFILAVDKGSLCLVLSAFDTLPEAEFQKFVPFLSVIVNKAGMLLGSLAFAIITSWCFYTGIGAIKGEIYQQMANNMHYKRASAIKQSRYRIYQLHRCFVNVCRVYSLGCKNTSGQNEMFFNSLPHIQQKKEC